MNLQEETKSFKPLPLFRNLEEQKETAGNAFEQQIRESSSKISDAVPQHPVLEEIAKLKLDELTPIEALNKLHSLKEQIASSGKKRKNIKPQRSQSK